MLPSILPLGGSSIEWDTFLKACQQALGYNPLKGVDNTRRELSDPAKFIAALAAFHDRQKSNNPIGAIRDATTLLRHLSYTFIIHCDEELISLIRERTDLTITSTETPNGTRVAVVTGTLQQYRAGTLECCVPEAPFNLRYLFDGFVLYFERLGLEEVWSDTRKKALEDKTFLLEYKP